MHPQPPHRDRRGRSRQPIPFSPRITRSRACPHPASRPAHPGQRNLPAASRRSTTRASPSTVTIGASAHLARPSRHSAKGKREGRRQPERDHGGVAHEKGQPSQVALQPILTVNGARRPLHPHRERRRTAVNQYGQVIDVLLSTRRDLAAARRFFIRALRAGTVPAEVTTDRAPSYPRVLDELIPTALHTVEQYANNPVEADHGRLKARLRPMRGLKRHRSARILATGHAFVQNLRRGHYDIATEVPSCHRLRVAFNDLAFAI